MAQRRFDDDPSFRTRSLPDDVIPSSEEKSDLLPYPLNNQFKEEELANFVLLFFSGIGVTSGFRRGGKGVRACVMRGWGVWQPTTSIRNAPDVLPNKQTPSWALKDFFSFKNIF